MGRGFQNRDVNVCLIKEKLLGVFRSKMFEDFNPIFFLWIFCRQCNLHKWECSHYAQQKGLYPRTVIRWSVMELRETFERSNNATTKRNPSYSKWRWRLWFITKGSMVQTIWNWKSIKQISIITPNQREKSISDSKLQICGQKYTYYHRKYILQKKKHH